MYGPDRQAYVKTEFGEVIDKPLHHRKCEPQNEESILVQNLDRECRRSIRKGEKTPREAHMEGLGKAAEIGAESVGASLQKLFPPWDRVRSSYLRQKDLQKKASLATAMNEHQFSGEEDESNNIAHYAAVVNQDNCCEDQPPPAVDQPAVELSPAMVALKNQIMFEVQQTIRNEVTRAVSRAAVAMEQRIETKIMQIFDEIFRKADDDVEVAEIDEYAMQQFPSTSENSTFLSPKRQRFENTETYEKRTDGPFSIPACYLSRNRDNSGEIREK
ncbi:unnamed protein product [Gongylonema pulchrum]|uniref:Uncharacterized protein n=1 Tax=Gongylonema pulchrum TaxID=637853 RepID=A0A183D434_9BILA|nr:unnamed protein product [Gongylonema pulchrum]